MSVSEEMICEICGNKFKSQLAISCHIANKHHVNLKDYYDEYIKQDGEGICKTCGKPTKFDKMSKGYRRFCCYSCATKNNETQEKMKATNVQKYSVPNVFMADEVKEKMKQTCLERYGVEYASQSEDFQDRVNKTNLEKYNVKRPAQSTAIMEKMKQTCLERYGVDNYRKTAECVNKINNTKRKNHTFGTSKPEKELEVELRKLFSDLKTQYKSKVYPFACDYYIPELDLYIEYNGTWTHGGKFFDKNDLRDLEKLNQLTEKSKNSKFYRNAIETWTQRDILKLNTALKNNLNYIAWFNEEQAYDWIERIKYEKEKTKKTC